MSGYTDAVLADSPYMYWKMDEASGTVLADSSGHGVGGTLTGGPTLGSTELAHVGHSSILFAGPPSVGKAEGTLAFVSTRTVSFECMIEFVSLRAGINAIAEMDSENNFMVRVGGINNYEIDVSVGGQAANGATGANLLVTGHPYHLVVVKETSMIRVYLDGVEIFNQATGTGSVVPGIFTIPWEFGDARISNARMSDVAFYTYALTPAQVGQHYQASQNPVEAKFTWSSVELSTTFVNLSTDTQGPISRYHWTFGDGATADVANPKHTFPASGTYTVTLDAYDNFGGHGSVSHDVTVTAANQSPLAAFTVSADGRRVTVDASSSVDPDGSIVDYAWAFGDGGSATGVSTTHTYAADGEYLITLTVTDNQGAPGTANESVAVVTPNVFVVPTVDEPPVALDRLFIRYKLTRGITIIKKDGAYRQARYPTQTDLEEADAYYIGGHRYLVNNAEASALTAAGYGAYLTLWS